MPAIDALFPLHVVSMATDIVRGAAPSPFACENAVIAHASGRRRDEFLTARACAHAALRCLGTSAANGIGVGEARNPIWPDGTVGSISHADDVCSAVVARAIDYRAIGVDVERNTPLPASLLPLVLTDCEREQLDRWDGAVLASGVHSIAWFSMKESVYKAWFGATGRRLAFGDVNLTISSDGAVRAHIAGALLHGRLAVWNGFLVAAAWVANAGALAGGRPHHGDQGSDGRP